jgi:hypothetical protein
MVLLFLVMLLVTILLVLGFDFDWTTPLLLLGSGGGLGGGSGDLFGDDGQGLVRPLSRACLTMSALIVPSHSNNSSTSLFQTSFEHLPPFSALFSNCSLLRHLPSLPANQKMLSISHRRTMSAFLVDLSSLAVFNVVLWLQEEHCLVCVSHNGLLHFPHASMTSRVGQHKNDNSFSFLLSLVIVCHK